MEMDEHQAKLLAAMMKNSKGSSPVFQALADDDHGSLVAHAKAAVDEARDPGTPRERLQELGASGNAAIRRAVAAREDCPLGLMIQLSADGAHEVREALAGNPGAKSVLEQMAHDHHHDVLKALATNPSVPHATLVGLASHKRRDVRKTALARLLEIGRNQQSASTPAAPELHDRPRFPPTQAPPQGPSGGAW
jgi:hypothetical protein